MKSVPSFSTLALSLLLGASALPALAQTASSPATAEAPVTRAQVKMDRNEFLQTHRWDPVAEVWMLKEGVEPPTGVASRTQVKSERDEFLRRNRWNPTTGRWEPVKVPRDLSTLSRQQVREETRQFARTHEWDGIAGAWVDKPARRTQAAR